MLVTLLGIMIDDKLVHSEKAPISILEMLFGILTEVRLLQPLKAK